ncbi:efhc2 [Symbiodinium natans]|uniref:Efhc2 protein n=1 Tax=Symbiodinium natans TaxID=878477 RepID=A0A812RMI9_9DINO|nr:efhc2 [Symbiodinium natans]
MSAQQLSKSISLPGLLKIGTEKPKGFTGNARKTTLGFKTPGNLRSMVDLKKTSLVSDHGRQLAALMATAGWRVAFAEPPPPEEVKEEDLIPKNMRYPRITPAWLKHEKQVLRFYAFFQESVPERWDENSRYRHVYVMYFMEDGTIGVNEPKVENSGLTQGTFMKRQRILNEDGVPIGPDDMRVGHDLTLHGRTYHISGCDRFTRWFFEENGIELAEDEDVPTDHWQKGYRTSQVFARGGAPLTRAAVEDKAIQRALGGIPPIDKKLAQFLLNDRKVLRFKGYWDDHTPYGSRVYFIIHYYLADNTCEINEAHCRNSGRAKWPVFMKRGPLRKSNFINATPGMLSCEAPRYLPEDLKVGDSINVWGRTVVLWDCDDFTRSFYKDYLGIDQASTRIDVSEKPLTHAKLHPPPHCGVGKEEDSLLNCSMIQPKPPKVDLERMMKLTGEVLRFECKMINGEPEDELRRLVIAYYAADGDIAVFEVPVRNSGHMGGKFADKRRIKNPDTGLPFQLSDFYVGQVVTIAAQPLQIIRADERCLQFLEARPRQFPFADAKACAKKLLPLAENSELQSDEGVHPDRLKDLASEAGIPLVDHEIVTLLRRFGVPGEKESDQPKIIGQDLLFFAKNLD